MLQGFNPALASIKIMISSEPQRVLCSDGYPLAATVFRSPGRVVEQVVLICGAMGVRQIHYYEFAEFVAESGCAVITFDYRGLGSSAPGSLRGFDADLEDWGRRDLATMIDHAGALFAGRPLLLVTHSVGGQLLGLAANIGAVSRVLALGSQSGYWRHWSGVHRFGVWLLWYLVIPLSTRLFGYFPARRFGLGEDLPREVARRWAFWGRCPHYVIGRLDAASRSGYRQWRGRLRALTAEDDTFATETSVRAFIDFFPAARTEFGLLKPREHGLSSIGHFGYFRATTTRRLWPSWLTWLLAGD